MLPVMKAGVAAVKEGRMRRKLWLAIKVALGLAAVLLLMAAEPGSKDDPLATVGYVERYAQFVRVNVAASQSLRLGVGTEFIMAEPLLGEVAVRELDPMRDTVLDLSAGATLGLAVLTPAHHYINASTHDIFLRPEEEVALLLRGEWK